MSGAPHYRAPMRSRRDDISPYAGAARGIAQGLCGIGGRLDPPPTDLAEAVEATQRVYGERRAQALARFAAVPSGAVVWTRDADFRIHRGVVTGPWSYDASSEAHALDLVHVRACSWEPVPNKQVPAAVHRTFARGGRNFQRITALGGS